MSCWVEEVGWEVFEVLEESECGGAGDDVDVGEGVFDELFCGFDRWTRFSFLDD